MAQVVGYSEISISEYADGAGLYDSIPYYLASSQSEGVTIYDEGWSREVPVLTPEEKYLWIYYVSRYSAGTTEPEILTVYGNPAVVEYEGDDAPADKVLVEIEPDIAKGMDQTPYIYRAVSDSSVTDLKNHEIISEITGGTIAWNQQAPSISTFEGGSQVSTYTVSGDTATIVTNASNNNTFALAKNIPFQAHKYLVSADIKGTTIDSTARAFYAFYASGATGSSGYIAYATTSWATYATIISNPSSFTGQYRIGIRNNGSAAMEYQIKNIQLFDLTQMFGSTIADYIYSLEQSTAGAGVSLFKSLFPKDYYPYNAGELMSVKTSARETTGKNLLNVTNVTVSSRTFNVDSDRWITAENKTSDPRPWKYKYSQWFVTLPKGTYCLNIESDRAWESEPQRGVRLILANDETIMSRLTNGSESFTLTELQTIGVMAKIYGGSIRLQIEGGSASTSYEPYQKHAYPLSNIELRGIPKLVNNKIQYDGDIYKADGSVTIKYGIVDLGTLTWNAIADGGFYVSLPDIIKNCKNAIASTLLFVPSANDTTGSAMFGRLSDKQFAFYQNLSRIFVKDTAYTTAESFKTAMSGVYLVYELASPTTETTTPYTETQICDADGTEEFIDSRDVQIPVGHKTSYIQAYDDIHMEHCGFNQWDEEWEVGTLDGTGENYSATNIIRSKNYIRVIPNATYYYRLNSTYGLFTWGYDSNKNYVGRIPSNSFAVSNNTVTIPSDVQYIRIVAQAGYGTTYNNDICINLSKTTGSPKNGDYEPYYHENLSFSLGEPVYGGTVDVANYKTTKKYGMIDLGTLTWSVNTAGADGKIRMQVSSSADIPNMKKYSGWSYTHILCSRYPARNINVAPYIDKSIGQYNDRVLVYDSDYTDAAAFKAAMDGVYLIYELAEPEESTFQP